MIPPAGEGDAMDIGIIGAGHIGAALARKLAAAGHDVKLANSRDPDTIRALAQELGVAAVTAREAALEAEVLILSVPFGRMPGLAGVVAAAPAGAVVIDTSNYYPFRDGAIVEVDGGEVETAWAERAIGRPLVKAWNACIMTTLSGKGHPAGAAGRIALPVAGNDGPTKAVAIELVELTGFDAVDAGSIAESWRFQPGTPAYCTELPRDALVAALAAADRDSAPLNRDEALRAFLEGSRRFDHDETIARNRRTSGIGG